MTLREYAFLRLNAAGLGVVDIEAVLRLCQTAPELEGADWDIVPAINDRPFHAEVWKRVKAVAARHGYRLEPKHDART